MVKIDPKFYRVRVSIGDFFASHIVLVYNLDEGRKFIGMEFYRLGSSVDDTGISIPSGRMFSFKEELRILDQASTALEGRRENVKEYIEAKIKEVYGEDVKVLIEQISVE